MLLLIVCASISAQTTTPSSPPEWQSEKKKALAQTDLDKMKMFAEQFRRDDVRILAKMLPAGGILKEKVALEGIQPFNSFEDYYKFRRAVLFS